jgi:hypothetical protein
VKQRLLAFNVLLQCSPSAGECWVHSTAHGVLEAVAAVGWCDDSTIDGQAPGSGCVLSGITLGCT